MIHAITKLANLFDQQNQTEKADRLDDFISRWAAKEKEPTLEDLMREEEWLEESGINPETLTPEDALSGLEGEEREIAEQYMSGVPTGEILKKLDELKEQQDLDVEREKEQQALLDYLSEILYAGGEFSKHNPSLLPRQQKITPEAFQIIDTMIKLSESLDEKGKFKEADYIDQLMNKFALGPEDFYEEFSEDPETHYEFEEDEPTGEFSMMEPLKEPSEEDDLFYRMQGFLNRVAQGMYSSMEELQAEAQDILTELEG